MAIQLLRTKLYIPPPQPGLVHRPHLTTLINDNLNRRLTLISAPAGFGKTTILSEWISNSLRPVSWLSLEEADNDPARFWTYFLAALQVVQENLGKDAQAFLYPEGQQTKLSQPESFLTMLLNDISAFPDEFAMVLDDYQHIHNQAIHESLIFLIDHLPPRMHLLLTCRADPPLPLSRLRARGQMTELRSEDLRFTPEEITIFLNQMMQLSLSSDQIAALESRTEGWIAGLQLAAISMKRSEDATGFIEAFTGSHRFILDYLVDEVLSCQAEEVQSFLLDTSVLERFTGPLCNAVTGREDGQAMLEQLEQANLFILPLDNERRWYRYHHLFADLLRSRLQELKPGRVSVLHLRACAWFECEGLLPEAIQHAITVKDYEKAAQLIEKSAEPQRQQGEIATLTGWINTLPGSIRRSHPALSLAYARALVDTSQNTTIESLIEDAEAGLEREPFLGDLRSDSLRGQIAALRAYLAMIRHQYEETIEFSRFAKEHLGEEEARWRSFVDLILAGAYRFTNNWAAADQTYLEASELSQAAGDKVNALIALSLRAEVLQAQGHLHRAAGQFEQVLQLAQEFSIPTSPMTGYALVGLGRAWCEWNDLETAERYARKGIEYAQKAGILDILLRGWLALSRIRQARGDFVGALDALENAEPTASQIGVAEIKDWIDAQRVQVWIARGETGAAIGWAASYSGNLDDAIYPSLAVALAKARLAQGRPSDALELLEHALQSAHAVGRHGNAIQILVTKALVQHSLGDRENAYATLSRALTLAEPEGYLRVFLDEGEPVQSLLTDFRSSIMNRGRGIVPDNQIKASEYTQELLNSFKVSSISFYRNLQSSIPEPLSERELEVLRLMAAGLSNRDIADKDFVSINTVKTQVKSIYGKLGTHNREDTLAAARELGLL